MNDKFKWDIEEKVLNKILEVKPYLVCARWLGLEEPSAIVVLPL